MNVQCVEKFLMHKLIKLPRVALEMKTWKDFIQYNTYSHQMYYLKLSLAQLNCFTEPKLLLGFYILSN